MNEKSYSTINALISLCLVMLIDSIGLGIIFPLLNPLFMESQGILPVHSTLLMRETLYGITLSIFTVGMFFAAPILGDISDRVGRKKILLLSLGGTAAAYLLSALAISISSVSLLLLSRLLAGVFAGSQTLSQAATIDISPEHKKANYLSILFFFNSFGFVLGPLLGGFLSNTSWVSWFNMSTPLYFAAILATLNFFFLQRYYPETWHGVAVPEKLVWHKAMTLTTKAFTDPALRLLSIIFVFQISSWALYYEYIGVLLEKNYGYSSGQVGVFLAGIAFFLGITLLVVVPKLGKHFNHRVLACAGGTILGCGLMLTWTIHSVLTLWLGSLLSAMGTGLFYVNGISLISNAVGPERQGQTMGILTSLGALCWTVTAAVSGVLLGIGALTPFIAAAVGVFCSLLVFVRFLKTRSSA